MDYDDTDFQSQNFRLAGEDNSKFPSGLRPFALPKLDIDDQLQSHLRFDNLIDSEGFFSVQGQDNSWIEVLSTGSSVVDFSSSAAESCSISRTNNVWSEATSTESVEMLLKSVGENEMTGNIDGSVHHQLSGMDSQTDPSNMQPKSSNSPTGNTVVPAEYDQSKIIRSKMMEGPSRIHPQLEHITPFSMDGKADQAIGSTLSDMESDYMLVAHDDDSLDNLNVHSVIVDSGKLNNEPFSDLAPLQNIYATNSYHFEQDNQESGICVTPQDSETLHMNESKVEGLHELQNLPCTRQPLGTTALSSEISNETLLSESSDGLLQAITNPVKMLHMRNDTCKRASATLQPTFLQVEHVTAGLEDSVDRRHEPLVKDFGISEETNSAESHQSKPESINLSPRITTLSSTKSGELIQSPKEEQLAQATGAPEEPTNDADANIDRSNEPLLEDIGISEEHIAAKSHQSEPDSINLNPHIVSVLSTKSGELIQSPKGEQLAHVEEAMNDVVDDANISTGDDPKLGVLEQHQDSVDNLQSGLMEEKTIRERLPAVSRNIEQMVDSGHDENATGVISTSEDKLDSSGNIVPQNSPASLLDEKDPSISSVDHKGSFKEGAAAALEDDLGNQHPASPYSDHQEKKSTQSNISRSNIDSTAVIDALDISEDKPDCSVSLALDDSSAGIHDEKISSVNDEGSPKEGGESALEVVGHSVTSAVSDPLGNTSAASVSPNISAVCSSGFDTVTKTPECEERASSLGSLKTSETQDKSGDHSDGYRQKFQTDVPLTESEHHKDLVAPSTVGVSSDMDVEEAVKTPLNGNDDLNTHLQDHTSGTISSEEKVGLEPGGGDGSSADATCGSPTVISCTEPCPQEDGHDSNSLLHHTPTEQSEDLGAAIDASQRSKENIKPVVSSEETNTTGDDRSFSFEVGASPIVPEKAHSPAWSPLPRSEASQSTKTTTEIPKPASPSGNPSKNISDDSKKISAVETGKDQLSGRKVVRSAGAPSISSHIGDSTALVVYQPFTDLQHVQLRAQIFVYGALIQGIPPAEAYMISAFGETGGGKPAWEAVWRAAVERFQNQKSPFTALDTPTSSCIGSRVTEKASIGTAVKTAPTSKRCGKTVLPPHTAVTLNSPTFNMSPLGSSTLHLQRGTHLDFSQVVSPVFPSQTRQPTSGAASWFPQNPGPRPAPWLVPPQNLIFDSSMQSAVPTIETAKGASSKNISISQSVSPAVFPPCQTPIVSPPLAVKHEEKQKTSPTSKRGATTQKSRKRKKASASPEQQPDNSFPQLKTDIASVTPATKRTPGFTLSTHSPSNVLCTGLVSDTGLISSVPDYQITVGKCAEQKMIFSEQIRGAIEQSLGQAKTASMHSMEAVGHSEGIWNHVSTNSRGNLPVEVEGKLASAAAAASAAVSVAKAAAEAAKMASEAALQARMMAEEALSVNSLHVNDSGVNSSLAIVPSLTPTSSWKLKDSSHAPGSIISMAREVARKRVEEASAAAKRAENLDEILKAAELAAEAVFKAGTIIGMGEPLPFTLSELLEAGPDGYWKSDLVRNKKVGNAKNNPLAEQSEVPIDFSKSGRKRGGKTQNLEPSSIAKELQTDGVQSGNGVDDAPTTAPLDGNRHGAAPNIIWNGIEKGSVVEVLADKGGFGVAWFSANVLDLNEDSACISFYTSSEGTGLRKEWLPLKQEGEKAPQIRLPHPATISSFKGTRKRRRDMAESYSWVVGDHVEAWTRDSWREGIISQNFESDETKFVVQFSVAGDTLVVDAWNLRPSLVWKDGQWTEWSRAQEKKVKSNKGDSPYEKRQRTESRDHAPMGAEAAGPSTDKGTNSGTKPDEPKPLALSDKDMVFNVGKSIVEKKTGGVAFKRPGLQKEGSRVVGVPKHGKKKKFMEVSKHYDADQADKISDGNASTRLAKHGVPHVQRPQESTSRVDQKAKRIAETRSRGLKSTKSQNVATNTIPGKGTLCMSVPSSGVFQSSSAFAGSTTGSSNTMNHSVQKNSSSHGIGLRAEDASVSESHVQASSTAPTSKKNSTTTDRAKRKYVPSMENLNRSMVKFSEIPGKSNSDSSEPRRSNRRIQPTSRLLEGLQSSLVVSKVPGEKGPRTNYRSASSRGRTL